MSLRLDEASQLVNRAALGQRGHLYVNKALGSSFSHTTMRFVVKTPESLSKISWDNLVKDFIG